MISYRRKHLAIIPCMRFLTLKNKPPRSSCFEKRGGNIFSPQRFISKSLGNALCAKASCKRLYNLDPQAECVDDAEEKACAGFNQAFLNAGDVGFRAADACCEF